MHTDCMSVRLCQERPDDRVRVEIELASDEPMARLRGLRAATEQLDRWQRELVAEARRRGASWSEIGEALDVSKQAAWASYNEDVRRILVASRHRSGLTDEEAQAAANEERQRARGKSAR